MLFNSLEFLFFFIVVFILYLILNHRWQNRMLIVASCLFYAAWNPKFLSLMFLSITTDYWCSNKIYACADPKVKKRFLFLSIGVNLGILGFFKYFNFFLANGKTLIACFSPSAAAFITPALHIILPLGISFYTFEAISYTVDVYRGVISPARNYWDYVLFVIYFPHMIAGPIMRAKDFLPQITTKRHISSANFYEGCFLIYGGLFEKMFVADNLSKIVDAVFSSAPPYEGGKVLLALYAFSFQIFCDFDGYSNIARGLGKCMGFDITINFTWPYFTSNPVDFWRHWHISLSSWLRDYVYIPFGGNQGSWAFVSRNLLLTMAIGGLWHGASWTFVWWGLYHGILLVAYKLYAARNKMAVQFKGARILSIIGMFHLTAFGWLLFRAQSMAQVGAMLHAIVFGINLNESTVSTLSAVLGFILPAFLIQWGQWKNKDILFLYRLPWMLRIFCYALMAYLMLEFGVMKTEQFIYFQF